MTSWPQWTDTQLSTDRVLSVAAFRRERLVEPLEDYLGELDQFSGVFEELIEQTVDLTQLEANALAILCDDRLVHAFRYLAGPPISQGDLETLAEAKLSKPQLQGDASMVARLLGVINATLDRRRFPWLSEDRDATEAERAAAILTSAALMATQKVATMRRNSAKKAQEDLVEATLVNAGLQQVARRDVSTFADAPKAGEYCRESKLGGHKADFIVGLWDNRLMGIECKVSNTEVNSFKRIVKEAAGKAKDWHDTFGRQVVSVAVLGGGFSVRNLKQAQQQGLCLCWAHDLQVLETWLTTVKVAAKSSSLAKRRPKP